MPLSYDDIPGSWGTYSEGWPETPYTPAKMLLCTKANIVPYGSYVIVGSKRVKSEKYPYNSVYDYSEAKIRVETEDLKNRLESVYNEMFVSCKSYIEEDLTWLK